MAAKGTNDEKHHYRLIDMVHIILYAAKKLVMSRYSQTETNFTMLGLEFLVAPLALVLPMSTTLSAVG